MDILQISWCGAWKTNAFASIQDFTEFPIFEVIHNTDF